MRTKRKLEYFGSVVILPFKVDVSEQMKMLILLLLVLTPTSVFSQGTSFLASRLLGFSPGGFRSLISIGLSPVKTKAIMDILISDNSQQCCTNIKIKKN